MIALYLAKYWRLIAITAAVVALIAGYFAWQSHQRGIGAQQERAIWQEAIAEQKRKAGEALEEERAKITESERLLNEARSAQETKDTTNARTIETLSAELSHIKRLRDPYAKPGCGCGGSSAKGEDPASTVAGADNGAQASGLLSEGLSDLLRNLTRESDEINIAYASCRQDAMKVRELSK